MKRLAVVAILLTLISAYVSCRKDVFVEPPPSLTGDYKGTYTIAVPSQTAQIENVRWQFRADSYIMRLDTTVSPNDTVCCNSLGNYTLGNNVELEVIDPNLDQGACDENKVPQGVFGLDQSTAGVVFLRQVRGDTTFEIYLEGPLN